MRKYITRVYEKPMAARATGILESSVLSILARAGSKDNVEKSKE